MIIGLQMLHQLDRALRSARKLVASKVSRSSGFSFLSENNGSYGWREISLQWASPSTLTDDRPVECASFTENTRPGRTRHQHISPGEKISINQAALEADYRVGGHSSGIWDSHIWMVMTVDCPGRPSKVGGTLIRSELGRQLAFRPAGRLWYSLFPILIPAQVMYVQPRHGKPNCGCGLKLLIFGRHSKAP
jgi:hypothetical protein